MAIDKILNFAGFQAVWFSCVLGAAKEMYWLAYLATTIFVLMHFLLSKQRQSDFALCVFGAGVGLCVDSLIMNAGLFSFNQHQSFIIPLWLLCLWIVFPLTINSSLSWMREKYLLAAIFGAIGGSLSYLAGQKLGAIVLEQSVLALSLVGLAWAIITPLFLLISEHYEIHR